MKKLIILFLFQLPIMLLGQLPSNDKNWSSTPKFKEDFSETRNWQNTRIDNTSTDNVTFEAGGEVILNGGFEIQQGGVFEINMNGCGDR